MTGDEASERHDETMRGETSLRTRFDTAVDRFTGRWDPLSGAIEKWARHSRSNAALERFSAIVRDARVVRWLTTEPDPEPIVIDLRESWVLGPPLSILERVLPRLETAGGTSRAKWAGRAIAAWFERYAVPAASLLLLGVVASIVATTWRGASPLWLVALAIAGLAGVIGLGVDRSRVALGRSRIAHVTIALVTPPEVDESRTDAQR